LLIFVNTQLRFVREDAMKTTFTLAANIRLAVRFAWLLVPCIFLVCGCAALAPQPDTATPNPANLAPVGPPPTQNPAAPAVKTSAMQVDKATWTLVVLGDSEAFGFGEYYADAIRADLGLKEVSFLDRWKGGLTTGQLLKLLREDATLRAELSNADVITFEANPADHIGWYITDGSGKFDCSTSALSGYKADIDAIIAELFALRKGQPTLFRAMDFYSPIYSWWKEWGCYENCKACWESFNATLHISAAEHGIPTAGIYAAFNGPQGGEDPVDKGYIGQDGEHTSIEGQRLMAELFRKLGYTGLIP
jgi:hypothetical protein